MKNYPFVSIIIANWNGGEVFKICLDSLNKLNYPSWELIVVDNNSSDGSENFVIRYKQIKNHKLIKNKTNLGFAKANNQGYKKSRGKYVLLLNNDTKVTQNFLKVLVNKMEKDNNLGVIQPKILLMDKADYLDNVGSFLTRTGFLEHWGYMEHDSPRFNKEKEIFSAKGACMLIRKNVINEVGLFDKDFISYMEETDFCWRVWLVGYKVVFYPKAKIYHKVGFTSKKQNQIFVNYNSYKNRLASLIKNLELGNLFYIGSCHLVVSIFLASYYFLKFQFSKSQMILGAVWWNIIYLRKTLAKRKKIQSFRKIKDKNLFPIIMHPINLKAMFFHFVKIEANFKE